MMMTQLYLEFLVVACIAISRFHALDIDTHQGLHYCHSYDCVAPVIAYLRGSREKINKTVYLNITDLLTYLLTYLLSEQ